MKTEDDPLDPSPAHGMGQMLDAMRQLESMVGGLTDITGVILRYGSFYGPGTSLAPGGDIFTMVRKRQFPIVGDGAGVWSFVHIGDPGVSMMTRIRGSSNAKARRVLPWDPAYPSWREGFRQVLKAAA